MSCELSNENLVTKLCCLAIPIPGCPIIRRCLVLPNHLIFACAAERHPATFQASTRAAPQTLLHPSTGSAGAGDSSIVLSFVGNQALTNWFGFTLV